MWAHVHRSVHRKRMRSVKNCSCWRNSCYLHVVSYQFLCGAGWPWPCGSVYTDFLGERKEGRGAREGESRKTPPLPRNSSSWHLPPLGRSAYHIVKQTHVHTHSINEAGLQLKDDSLKRARIHYTEIWQFSCQKKTFPTKWKPSIKNTWSLKNVENNLRMPLIHILHDEEIRRN